eukprot:gene12500-15714_t
MDQDQEWEVLSSSSFTSVHGAEDVEGFFTLSSNSGSSTDHMEPEPSQQGPLEDEAIALFAPKKAGKRSQRAVPNPSQDSQIQVQLLVRADGGISMRMAAKELEEGSKPMFGHQGSDDVCTSAGDCGDSVADPMTPCKQGGSSPSGSGIVSRVWPALVWILPGLFIIVAAREVLKSPRPPHCSQAPSIKHFPQSSTPKYMPSSSGTCSRFAAQDV